MHWTNQGLGGGWNPGWPIIASHLLEAGGSHMAWGIASGWQRISEITKNVICSFIQKIQKWLYPRATICHVFPNGERLSENEVCPEKILAEKMRGKPAPEDTIRILKSCWVKSSNSGYTDHGIHSFWKLFWTVLPSLTIEKSTDLCSREIKDDSELLSWVSWKGW